MLLAHVHRSQCHTLAVNAAHTKRNHRDRHSGIGSQWASTSSCEKYVDDTYQDPDGFMRSIFDWMVRDQAPPEDWNGWSGYDGPQDEADDGISSPLDEDDDDVTADADDA
jgi:hypothetical protein